MTSMIRELEHLNAQLLSMGALVEEAITKAVTALCERRSELVDEVIAGDKRIDAMENEIDEEAHRLLALHQPVAQDLRLVMSVLKVNDELERMGDHSKNIAKAALDLVEFPPLPIYKDLDEMGKQVLRNVKRSLDCAVNRDMMEAQTVRDADADIDIRYRDIFQKSQDFMSADSKNIKAGVQIIAAVRNLERIGDLATNIAKDVIFLVSGTQVRHGGATTETLDG